MAYSFTWIAVSQFTAILVPVASLGTVQGLISGVFLGLGSGVGQFVGGILIDRFGAVLTFYIFAVLSAVSIVLFYVSQKVSVRSMKLNNLFFYSFESSFSSRLQASQLEVLVIIFKSNQV